MPGSGKEQTAADKANLARIRDNQRRSRARRKEYLEELEHRVRVCQAQGVEASAEIQFAARKVAEENKVLRLLLNKHGVSDDSIDAFVMSTSSASPTSSTFGILSPTRSVFDGVSPTHSCFEDQGLPRGGGAVQKIEQLLIPKRPNIDKAYPAAPSGRSGRSSRHGSISGLSGPASSPKRHTPHRTLDISLPARPRFATANSFNNHNATPPGFVLGLPPKTAKTMPTTPQLISHNVPPTPDSTEPSPGFDLPLDWKAQSDLDAASFLGLDRNFSFSNNHYDASQNMYQHHYGEVPTNYMPVPVTSSGPTSCSVATDIISTMATVDPHQVRAGLGCGPGMDCQIDDFTFNGAMDRYTAMSMPI